MLKLIMDAPVNKTAYPPLQFGATPGDIFYGFCLFVCFSLGFQSLLSSLSRSHLRFPQHEMFRSNSFLSTLDEMIMSITEKRSQI